LESMDRMDDLSRKISIFGRLLRTEIVSGDSGPASQRSPGIEYHHAGTVCTVGKERGGFPLIALRRIVVKLWASLQISLLELNGDLQLPVRQHECLTRRTVGISSAFLFLKMLRILSTTSRPYGLGMGSARRGSVKGQ
jgi:hypothetical protein